MTTDIHDVQLDPPIGTCYFKSYTTTFAKDESKVKFTINVTFYIYVTRAKPTDPNFTANGGKVYIIVVYSGSAKATGLSRPHFGLEDKSGVLSLMNQLPTTGSGTRIRSDRLYSIDLAQTMSMYNSGGNNGYSFPARYKRNFSVRDYTQISHQSGSSWGWSMDCKKLNPQPEPSINGLQIFETNKLAVVNPKLFCNFSPFGEDYSQEYSLDFSAQIMKDAVVGGVY